MFSGQPEEPFDAGLGRHRRLAAPDVICDRATKGTSLLNIGYQNK